MGLWSTLIRPSRPSPARRRRARARLAVEPLEGRDLLAAGGGFTAGGILGEYFANPDLDGAPAFTRRDNRIDFDWQGRAPGGSTSPDFASVGADAFSVRWTGQVIPRFSEADTFGATANGGVRLSIRPAGWLSTWTVLIDTWEAPTADESTATFAMAAGKTYDVRLEYRDADGPAVARLTWASAHTPEEVIDPAVSLGVNAVSYDFDLYADASKTGRIGWGDPVDYFGGPPVATDEFGWPTADAGHLFWESRDPAKTGGTYRLVFTGQAEVSGWMGRGRFSVDGTDYGQTLPLGV